MFFFSQVFVLNFQILPLQRGERPRSLIFKTITIYLAVATKVVLLFPFTPLKCSPRSTKPATKYFAIFSPLYPLLKSIPFQFISCYYCAFALNHILKQNTKKDNNNKS